MNERKIMDITMEDGMNVSVFMLNEESDYSTLLYIEHDFGHYYTYTSNNLNDFALCFYKDENCFIRFNYVSDDTIDYLRNEDNLDCLDAMDISWIRVMLDDYLRNEGKL